MWSLILVLLLAPTQGLAKSPNVNIYEQDPEKEKTQSFSAKVRVVRDISDETEVFFEGDKAKGAYILPRGENYATMLKNLEASKKPGGAQVSVTADAEKRIKSVEAKGSLGNSADGYQFPPANSNEAWDFEKAAESIKKK